MIERQTGSINASDARVFREIFLWVSADVDAAGHNVQHARRGMVRVRELARRAGIPAEQTPITDLLDVAATAVARAKRLVNIALDAGILEMRNVDVINTENFFGLVIDDDDDVQLFD